MKVVFNELIELAEHLVCEVRTFRRVAIIGSLVFILTSAVVIITLSSVIFLERQRFIDIIHNQCPIDKVK